MVMGTDVKLHVTISLLTLKFDSNSGFRITSGTRHHIFKPVSVQAMWYAFFCIVFVAFNLTVFQFFSLGLHSRHSIWHRKSPSRTTILKEEAHIVGFRIIRIVSSPTQFISTNGIVYLYLYNVDNSYTKTYYCNAGIQSPILLKPSIHYTSIPPSMLHLNYMN